MWQEWLKRYNDIKNSNVADIEKKNALELENRALKKRN